MTLSKKLVQSVFSALVMATLTASSPAWANCPDGDYICSCSYGGNCGTKTCSNNTWSPCDCSSCPSPAIRVSTQASYTAGIASTVSITVVNPDGSAFTGFSNAVHFGSSDSRASLPPDYAFTGAGAGRDNGSHSFSITFGGAGSQSLTVSDNSGFATTGSQTAPVNAGAVTHLVVTGLVPLTDCTPQPPMTIRAADSNGNTAVSYIGNVHLTSYDSRATLHADLPFGSADQGTRTVTGIVLRDGGDINVTARDTYNSAIIGTQTVAMAYGPLASLSLGWYQGGWSASAGNIFYYYVGASDACGNQKSDYRGTVTETTDDPDPRASHNIVYTFTAADRGSIFTGATFVQARVARITVTDVAANISTSVQVFVSAVAADHFALSRNAWGPHSNGLVDFTGGVAAGVQGSASYTHLQVLDQFGNVAGYSNQFSSNNVTIRISSSDVAGTSAGAPFPIAVTLTPTLFDYYFPNVFNTLGNQSLTVTDTASTSPLPSVTLSNILAVPATVTAWDGTFDGSTDPAGDLNQWGAVHCGGPTGTCPCPGAGNF